MRRPVQIALAAAMALMVFSCDTRSGFPPLGNSGPAPRGMIPLFGNPVSGTGTLVMQLTDAPADYAKVLVTIAEVAVHQAGTEPAEPDEPEASASPEENLGTLAASNGKGKPETTDDLDDAPADPQEEGGWVKLAVTLPMPVDLLTLQGRLAELGLAELPAATYTQIRVQVTSAQVVRADGTTHDVTIPSGTLKLVHPFPVGAGTQTQLTLDFDAEASLVQQGNGQFQLKPTIKVVAADVAAPGASPAAIAEPTPLASPSDEAATAG